MADTYNLNGVWGGRYWYTHAEDVAVPFSAWLGLVEGELTGTTLEPNTFVAGGAEELDALLRGHVAGDEMVFLKTYSDLDQEPVFYEGRILDDGQRITGRWFFRGPDDWSGQFEMTRTAAKTNASKAVEAKA
ncbi:MAG: hypothetical protein AAGB16_01400 [Pseudomonadota bacterium]